MIKHSEHPFFKGLRKTLKITVIGLGLVATACIAKIEYDKTQQPPYPKYKIGNINGLKLKIPTAYEFIDGVKFKGESFWDRKDRVPFDKMTYDTPIDYISMGVNTADFSPCCTTREMASKFMDERYVSDQKTKIVDLETEAKGLIIAVEAFGMTKKEIEEALKSGEMFKDYNLYINRKTERAENSAKNNKQTFFYQANQKKLYGLNYLIPSIKEDLQAKVFAPYSSFYHLYFNDDKSIMISCEAPETHWAIPKQIYNCDMIFANLEEGYRVSIKMRYNNLPDWQRIHSETLKLIDSFTQK